MPIDQILYGLMGALYVVAFYNCFRILGDKRAPASTLAWIIVQLGAPVFGVPLYFILGANRLRGYVKRHQTLVEGETTKPEGHWYDPKMAEQYHLGPGFAEFERINI